MFNCPNCTVSLTRERSSTGVFWRCASCNGRSATLAFLRKNMPSFVVNVLWQDAKTKTYPRKRKCPGCANLMVEVPSDVGAELQHLDVCTVCQFVWFDPDEY